MAKSEKVARGAVFNLQSLPRCGSKARSNGGQPCKQIAMKNGRCHWHGGSATGPKTPEGKQKSKMANYKFGYYTKEAIETRRRTSALLKECREDLKQLKGTKP